MNTNQLKLVALVEVGIIIALLVILMIMGPLTSGSSGTINNSIIDPNVMGNEVRIIEKELFIKNFSGNETFSVDDSWSAIGIYVEGITSSDVSFNITYPGFPVGAPVINGTISPFAEMKHEHISSSIVMGSASSIDDQPMGNWTLNYVVEGGLVKISIVKIEMLK